MHNYTYTDKEDGEKHTKRAACYLKRALYIYIYTYTCTIIHILTKKTVKSIPKEPHVISKEPYLYSVCTNVYIHRKRRR